MKQSLILCSFVVLCGCSDPYTAEHEGRFVAHVRMPDGEIVTVTANDWYMATPRVMRISADNGKVYLVSPENVVVEKVR